MGAAREAANTREVTGRAARVDERLAALEQQVASLKDHAQDVERVAGVAATSTAESMKAEFAKYVVSAVSSATDGTKKEIREKMGAHEEVIAGANKRLHDVEEQLQEKVAALRQQTTLAAHAADEAIRVADAARAGQTEIAHVGQRFRDLQADIVDVKASLNDKATRDSLVTLKAQMSKQVNAQFTMVEDKLRREFMAADEAQYERTKKELAMTMASVNRGKMDDELEKRLTSLDSKVARKIDAAQEYARLQEEAEKEGPTSQRLLSIQRAIAQLQEILLRVDLRSSATASPTPIGGASASPLMRPNAQSQADLALSLKLASI